MSENRDKEKNAVCGYCQNYPGDLGGIAYRECPLCKQWYGSDGPCSDDTVNNFVESKKEDNKC